jgi:hypothetical protein
LEDIAQSAKLGYTDSMKKTVVITQEDIGMPIQGKLEIINMILAARPKGDIRSQFVRLFAHLLKSEVEGHQTQSWRDTIKDSINQVNFLNARDTGGYFYNPEQLKEIAKASFGSALLWAMEETKKPKKAFREYPFDVFWFKIEPKLKRKR